MAFDASGNLYVTGAFGGTIDFGGGALSSGVDQALFVAKLDSAGAHLVSRSFSAGPLLLFHRVTLDSSGALYVASGFSGTLDFGPGPHSAPGYEDVVVARLQP